VLAYIPGDVNNGAVACESKSAAIIRLTAACVSGHLDPVVKVKDSARG